MGCNDEMVDAGFDLYDLDCNQLQHEMGEDVACSDCQTLFDPWWVMECRRRIQEGRCCDEIYPMVPTFAGILFTLSYRHTYFFDEISYVAFSLTFNKRINKALCHLNNIATHPHQSGSFSSIARTFRAKWQFISQLH